MDLRPRHHQVLLKNKELQFHLGHDDTALENLMRRLRSNRQPSQPMDTPSAENVTHSPSPREQRNFRDMNISAVGDHVLEDEGDDRANTIFKRVYIENNAAGRSVGSSSVATTSYGGDRGIIDSSSIDAPLRLSRFLRRACVVIETLCEENLLIADRPGASGESALRDCESSPNYDSRGQKTSIPSSAGLGWVEVGFTQWMASPPALGNSKRLGKCGDARDFGDAKENEGLSNQQGKQGPIPPYGLEALLMRSDVVGLAFSRAKRSMLATAHAQRGAYPNIQAATREGLRNSLEGCSIVCIWHVLDAQVRIRKDGRKLLLR